MPGCTATILSYMDKNVKIGTRPLHVRRSTSTTNTKKYYLYYTDNTI